MFFELPTLTTERLVLRSPNLDDALDIQRLAGEPEIAANTLSIPHPYLDGMAEGWIQDVTTQNKIGSEATFAIVIRESKTLCGVIGLYINREDNRALLGYWIGQPYWGKGYCTEAAKAILNYGFNNLRLNRIYAEHFARNPASGKVMQKIGMTYEGCRRQHILKWDEYQDCLMYGILESDFTAT
jgi:[ribosomal protein S5]-alanine N-acetyltransferase